MYLFNKNLLITHLLMTEIIPSQKSSFPILDILASLHQQIQLMTDHFVIPDGSEQNSSCWSWQLKTHGLGSDVSFLIEADQWPLENIKLRVDFVHLAAVVCIPDFHGEYQLFNLVVDVLEISPRGDVSLLFH